MGIGSGCLLALAVIVLLNMNRSTLMKKLPSPRLERVVLEGSAVRHQTPNSNLIVSNYFDMRSLARGCYGVWLGSRNGRSTYRDQDAGHNFGSSIDNRDFANNNTLMGNLFVPAHPRAIRDDGYNNRIDP